MSSTAATTSTLFTPISVGAIEAKNRIFMAPMTRCRSALDGTPNAELLGSYYTQRASAGIIITEATGISRQGLGVVGAPGIFTDQHEAEWKKVVSQVHAAGGKIVLQLWHEGRVVHPDFLDGELPVAPSAIAVNGDAHTKEGKKPHVVPRALEEKEIPGVVKQYADATKRARAAGFDGVEIHAANGYLIDQFIRDGSNKRTDSYGGSIENRLRFLVEVIDAVVAQWSADHVGIRFSPTAAFQDMSDSDPVATFTRAAELVQQRHLAYLHLLEPIAGQMYAKDAPVLAPHVRKAYTGVLIVNGGYTQASGEAAIAEGRADAIAYGVPILANPDLVERYRIDTTEFNTPDYVTMYGNTSKGYNDYPTLAEALAAKAAEAQAVASVATKLEDTAVSAA